MPMLPDHGEASTYADRFNHRPTASGDTYTHDGFSAALLPKARWGTVPFGTALLLTYQGRSVVVKLNDVGGGNGNMDRVLDLSRAAYAFLAGRAASSITDQNAGTLQLTSIRIVPSNTKLGPVE